MKIKVGIVDDHKLFRTSFGLLLSQLDGVEVVFECSNGIELFEVLKTKMVDILFLDIQMPVMDGFEITSKLNDRYPDLKILILSSFNDSYTIERMLKYKIAGYLTKNAGQSQIKKAIYNVFEDGVYYDSQIRNIVKHLQDTDYKKDAGLTQKEVEIIKLFVKQYSGREIAEKLHLSVRTVEKHKEIIMQKTGANNFIGAVAYAIIRHYITEDDLF
ncbi:response regulator transcription factor [Myroides odoratimimus]|uniref:response regulator transcription factor n=1 Tax=Myroides odoratimimus TaxID=76832 RepID=UPI002578993B|nr:response regulator transcription factor [Myroides odoratimimus]MDM1519403.1 response regulator transcription factor [Myroides odoratimimus]